MRILQIAVLSGLTLAACAAPGGPRLQLPARGDPATVDQAFSAAIAGRYALRQPLEAVRADLGANHFDCESTPPVEARLPYLAAVCTRAVALSKGGALFTVRLETTDGVTLARAVGGFTAPAAGLPGAGASGPSRRRSAP